MGARARTLFPEQVGSFMDADFVVQRSGREAARRRIARRKIRQRLFYLHRLFMVPTIAGWCAGRVPSLREHGFAARFQMKNEDQDRKSTRLNSSHLGISYAV